MERCCTKSSHILLLKYGVISQVIDILALEGGLKERSVFWLDTFKIQFTIAGFLSVGAQSEWNL